jgi:hypothetical protein
VRLEKQKLYNAAVIGHLHNTLLGEPPKNSARRPSCQHGAQRKVRPNQHSPSEEIINTGAYILENTPPRGGGGKYQPMSFGEKI